jgi:sugar phosphate isomerase/epimerase
MTFDAAMVRDTRGRLYDTARMVPMLSDLIAMSEGTQLRVGVEDFPLDEAALDACRADLEPLLACPRYGILIDVGHLNIRLCTDADHRGVSVAEYFARVPLPVVEVHLHDNSGSRDEHGHFGLGNIDFGEVARALKAIDFQGVSTIEIAPSFHGSTPAESKPHSRASLAAWQALWEG